VSALEDQLGIMACYRKYGKSETLLCQIQVESSILIQHGRVTFDLMPTGNSRQGGIASQMKQILHSDFVVSISDSHVLLMTTDLPRN
jgi:hypothetical protein